MGGSDTRTGEGAAREVGPDPGLHEDWDSVGGPGELQEAYGQGRGRSALGPVGPGLGEVEPSPQIGQRPELGQGAEDMAEGTAQRLRV